MKRRTKKFLRNKARAIPHLFIDFIRPKTRTVKQVTYLGAKIVVFINEDIGWHLLTDRSFEKRDILFLESLIRPDDVCLDIGGNIGLHAVFMARKARKGKVFSFEPIPINTTMISLNSALNNLDNIHIIPNIVSNISGSQNISVSEDYAYSSIIPTTRKKTIRSQEFSSITIDDFAVKYDNHVDIVKIDVEGAELLVLEGAQTLLSSANKRPRVMLIEAHPDNTAAYGYKPGDLIDFLGKFGYVAHAATSKGLVPGWSVEEDGENIFFLRNDL